MIRNALFTLIASTMAVTAFSGTLALGILHVALAQPVVQMHVA